MHSSRMHTVCSSSHLSGGDVGPGVSAQGGVCLRVFAWGSLMGGWSGRPPPVDRMTDTCENIIVKVLPCHNYVQMVIILKCNFLQRR